MKKICGLCVRRQYSGIKYKALIALPAIVLLACGSCAFADKEQPREQPVTASAGQDEIETAINAYVLDSNELAQE